jgi:hypothetical protein
MILRMVCIESDWRGASITKSKPVRIALYFVYSSIWAEQAIIKGGFLDADF